jgi:hypothetical protein
MVGKIDNSNGSGLQFSLLGLMLFVALCAVVAALWPRPSRTYPSFDGIDGPEGIEIREEPILPTP